MGKSQRSLEETTCPDVSVASNKAVQTSEIIIRMIESGIMSLPSGGKSEHTGHLEASGLPRDRLLGVCFQEGAVGVGRDQRTKVMFESQRSRFAVWP